MNFINKLEQRFGRYAIPGLVRQIVVLNALVYLLSLWSPAMLRFLDLDPAAILHGQVWRLVTYIFIPNYGSVFGALFGAQGQMLDILFSLLFLWWIGEALEQTWGAFRLNLFYLVGMLGTTLAAFLFGADFSNGMLNLSLFFAFAWFYPEMQMLFIIFPVKVKWMAWFFVATVAWQVVTLRSFAYVMALAAALLNFLLFFGPEIFAKARNRQRVERRRSTFERASIPEEEPLHRCAVCHRTDISNPELEFRVAADGNDYCMEHLGQVRG